MALTKYNKSLRAKTLGRAVARLRKDLGLSQEGLAELVGGTVGVGMISRWENGRFSPSLTWRRRLAAIAWKHDCVDAAAAFEEPLHEWKGVILEPEDRHLLALFEIVLLNKPVAPDAWPEVLPWQTYERVVQSLRDAVDRLKQSHGEKFPPMKGRFGVMRLTDEHRAAWARETDAHAKEPTSQADDHAKSVIRYVDGRVEVRKRVWKEKPRGAKK